MSLSGEWTNKSRNIIEVINTLHRMDERVTKIYWPENNEIDNDVQDLKQVIVMFIVP